MNNPPAFPVPFEASTSGMTLRDYFAGQVLAGLSALEDNRTQPKDSRESTEVWRSEIAAHDVKWCYAMADAMLLAREKGQP